MYSAATSKEQDKNSDNPIARIDAQDESMVLPLREYLETHGVEVVINRPLVKEHTYYIVVGDGEFVKQIFSRRANRNKKSLAIVVGYETVDLTFDDNSTKVIFVDPKELSAGQVMSIFDFYFTSEKNSLDLRTRRLTRIIHEKPIHQEKIFQVSDKERIGTIINDVFGESIKPENKKKPGYPQKHRKKKHKWVVVILMGIGLIIVPTIWYLVSITVSGLVLASSARSMVNGNIKAVSWQSRVASYWIGQGNMVLGAVSIPLTWVGGQEFVRGQERLLSFFSDASYAVSEVNSMLIVGQSVASGLLNQVDVTGAGTTPASDIIKLRVSLDSVQNTLGLAQAQLEFLLGDRTFPFAISTISQRVTPIVSELSTIRDYAANMDELVSLFLQLAGFKETRTYLILLQNSAELRPTGGFIGSVAVATFDSGRMRDFNVQDVYTFDGQLKGHVDPPVPVKELLEQEHWYLRDSNWDPDFKASAARAAWFYQKETGASVDGVLAVNTPFIVEVLKATGPIDLPDYNDYITADNFYGKSIYYTQDNFFPGSTQKKDFLGALARAMITKITTSKTTNLPALFRAITSSLKGHDLLMMFGSPELESVVSHYGWAGRVPSIIGCVGTDAAFCRADPLIFVEANMGVNKANVFISRIVDRQVVINAEGNISETATITIKNTSGKDQDLLYRTYMRFLLPVGVIHPKVMLDGALVPARSNKTKIPPLPFFERTDLESGFYVLGIAMEVPSGSQKQLSISYSKENAVQFGDSGAVVDFIIQKQPGVSATPVHTVLRFPETWIAGLEEQAPGGGIQDFIAKTGQLEYNMVLDRDRITRIRFTK